MQTGQEAGRVIDVEARVQHVGDAAEMRGVVAVVDLHAAEVDQRAALAARGIERGERLGPACREDRFSFYVQGVGLKAALFSRLRQADRVEDAGGNAVAVGRAQDLGFARVGGRMGGAGRQAI